MLRILFGDKETYLEKFRTCVRCHPQCSQKLGIEFFEKENSKPLYNDNDILTLYNLYIYCMTVEVFKILKYRMPISLYSHFTRSQRKDTLLIMSSSSHNFIQRSSELWNLVRQKLKFYELSLISIGTMKASVRKFIVKGQKEGDKMTWNDNELNVKNTLHNKYIFSS